MAHFALKLRSLFLFFLPCTQTTLNPLTGHRYFTSVAGKRGVNNASFMDLGEPVEFASATTAWLVRLAMTLVVS